MNRYGLMAQKHWARWLPDPVRADRGSGQLLLGAWGRRQRSRSTDLALQLAGDDQPGEGYLGKAGRLGQATAPGGGDRPGGPDPAGTGTRHRGRPGPTDPGSADSTPRPARKLVTFRPATQDDLAPSGAVTRVRANLAALTTLRRIQQREPPGHRR